VSLTAHVSEARGVGAVADDLTPAPRARRAPRKRMAALVTVAPSLVLYGIFLVAPLVLILRYAFSDDSPGIVAVLVRPSVLRVLGTTAEAALYATIICAVISVMYAYAMQLAGKVWRMALTAALLGSLLASLIVRTYAFMIVTGDSGPFRRFIDVVDGSGDGSVLFSRPAVLIAMVHVTLPLSVLSVFSVMNRIPPHLLGAARTLGARPASAWLRVTLPLLAPGIAAGAALAFIQGVGMFVVPAFLGGTSDRVVGQLIDTNVALLGRITEAAILSILMILAVLMCLLVFRLLWPIETLFFADHDAGGNPRTLFSAARSVRQRGFLPREGLMGFGKASLGIERMLSLVPWGWVCRAVGVVTAAFLFLPYVVMVPAAFTQTGFITFPPEGFSLRWFDEVVSDGTWLPAAQNSVVVGLIATMTSMIAGVPLALALAKAKLQPSLRGAVLMLVMLPMLVPIVALALGEYLLFLDLGIIGRLPLLGVTHGLLGVPVVVTVLVSSLRHYDFNLDRAARTLGARPRQVFMRITTPLIVPALLTGAGFTFLHSLDELLIAKNVTTIDRWTLPVKLYSEISQGVTPALAAVSTMILTATFAGLLCGYLLLRALQSIRVQGKG
jgi:putative spermidine/putrescine transport system permease protein